MIASKKDRCWTTAFTSLTARRTLALLGTREPRTLSRLHIEHETPAVGIVLHGTLAALLAATGTFATLD